MAIKISVTDCLPNNYLQLKDSASLPIASIVETAKLINTVTNQQNRIFSIYENDVLVNIIPLVIVTTRIHGIEFKHYRPVGWNFFDYFNLSFSNSEIANAFKNELLKDAKLNQAHYLYYSNIFLNKSEQIIFNKAIKPHKNDVFDSKLDDKGWDWLLEKKSLKKVIRPFIKHHNYRFTHKYGNLTNDEIDFIARNHKQRWAFEGVSSPFHDSLRQSIYKSYTDNKLLTIIYDNDEWVAFHYGPIYNNTLLFHTPVINVKYLDHSPLRFLIYELAQYCKNCGIEVFDYGLGDEEYKKNYSNSSNHVFELLYPLTLKAKLFSLFTKHELPQKAKNLALLIINSLRRVKHWFYAKQCTVDLYISSDNDSIENEYSNFYSIDNYLDFIDFCNKYNFEPLKSHYLRFKNGATFYCLIENNIVVSLGWSILTKSFYLSEIQSSLKKSESFTMLYDFSTIKEYRNRGYYTHLLKAIRYHLQNSSSKIYVFASTNNHPSIKGIKNAGFKFYTYLNQRTIKKQLLIESK